MGRPLPTPTGTRRNLYSLHWQPQVGSSFTLNTSILQAQANRTDTYERLDTIQTLGFAFAISSGSTCSPNDFGVVAVIDGSKETISTAGKTKRIS